MVDTSNSEQRPSFHQMEGAETTIEYKRLQTVQMLMETLNRTWPTEKWEKDDFFAAVREVVKGVKKEDAPKLQKLLDFLKPSTEAANVPPTERSPEQQQVIAAEVAAADVDRDGQVSKQEAMQRVYDLMMQAGLEYAAAIFKQKRMSG